MPPEHGGGCGGQVDAVVVRVETGGVFARVRAHERVAEAECGVRAEVGQAEGMTEFVDRRFEAALAVETGGEGKFGADFAGHAVIIDHRPAAGADVARAMPVLEKGGPVTEIDENPPDVALACHVILLGGAADHLGRMVGFGILAAGGRLVALDVQHLDLSVGSAREQAFDSGRVAVAVHLGEQEEFGGVRELCQPVLGSVGNGAVGRREEDDLDQLRLVGRVRCGGAGGGVLGEASNAEENG